MTTFLFPVGLSGQLSVNSLSYFDYVVLGAALLAGTKSLGKGIFWDKPDPYYHKFFERPQLQHGQQVVIKKESRNIGQRLEDGNQDLVIFWGSQSGTAEGFAHRLANDLYQRLILRSLVLDLDDYDHETTSSIPDSKFAIFLLSTYGEGEPSDNAANFLKWVESTSGTDLTNFKFAALGLGNSNYRLYNKAVDDVATALQSRGAALVSEVGKADEAMRTSEEDFVEWKNNLITTLAAKLNLTQHEPEYQPTLNITEVSSQSTGTDEDSGSFKRTGANIASSTFVNAPVKFRRSLLTTSSATRDCLHLEVDISEHPQVKYKTGDHILIWPQNPEHEVARLIRILGLEEKKGSRIEIQAVDGNNAKLKLPAQTTIYDLLQSHLEIGAPVKRESLLPLAQHTASAATQHWLRSLALNKGAFTELLAHNHITLGRLLEHSCKLDPETNWSAVPLSLVAEILPPMSPRYYSISSSSIITPRKVAITVSVKPSPLPSNPSVSIPGLASTYLSSMPTLTSSETSATQPCPGTSFLPIQIRRSTFKLPFSTSTPIIMVAAGTGIAPFRAFIQQRARLAVTSGVVQSVGKMILFFGCQDPDQDFLYKDELLELQNSSALRGKLEIVTAYSRVANESERRYVQHRVHEHNDEVSRLMLEHDACLYICGAVKMAKAVGEVISEKIREVQDWDESKFAAWRYEKKRTKRWHEDVWG